MKRRGWLAGCTLAVCTGLAQLAARSVHAAVTPEPSPGGEPATQFLPLFPLRIVAFPGELVVLHIFEPRYKQLINESAESGINFGIVTLVPGGAANVGTEMKLDRVLRTDEVGNMDVTTRGLRVFRLQPEIQAALVQLYNRTKYRAGSRQVMAAPYPENLSFIIGHDVGLSQAQEIKLLTMSVERDRQMYLFQHLIRMQ